MPNNPFTVANGSHPSVHRDVKDQNTIAFLSHLALLLRFQNTGLRLANICLGSLDGVQCEQGSPKPQGVIT